MSGAKVYASALFSLSEELGNSDEVLENVKICRDVLKENPNYFTITDTPSIAVSEKLSLIGEAFANVEISVLNLLKILCEKHSVYIFPEVAKEYIALYNESRGICQAEIISAVALSGAQLDAIKGKIENMTGKTVTLKITIDKNVLGGIKLRYMGNQLDGTLKSRLNAIENGLKNTIL